MFKTSMASMKSTDTSAWVALCVAAVFGPYVVSGLRFEQIAFYGSAAFVVLTRWRSLPRILAPVRWPSALWAAYAGIAVVVGLLPVENRTPWETGSLLAGLDNALLPLATIITVSYWCFTHSLTVVVDTVAKVLMAAMSLNAVVALVGCFAGLAAMPWLQWFWAANGSATYVAELAEQMGRYSGIFNQPAEAGIAYTLAALSLAYLQRRGAVRAPLGYIAWALVVAGGALTLSKVFVGGLALALMLVLVYRRRTLATLSVALGTVAGMVALTALDRFGSWGASTMIGWYRVSVEAGDSPLYTLTAGRFGSAGTDGPPSVAVPAVVTGETGGAGETAPTAGVGALTDEIVADHPFVGLGARGLQVPYDSSWSEALVVGGLSGVAIIVAVHLLVVVACVRRVRRLGRVHGPLLVAVVITMLASSMGMPALTGNRESTLLWIFIVSLAFAGTDTPREEEAAGQAADRDATLTR